MPVQDMTPTQMRDYLYAVAANAKKHAQIVEQAMNAGEIFNLTAQQIADAKTAVANSFVAGIPNIANYGG